jgi:NitT/TauT family transport system ATP-binding protein
VTGPGEPTTTAGEPIDHPARGGAVHIDGVSCVFQHRKGHLVNALQDVSFTVEPGELVCVVGPSGHGKTTLLRVIAGLQPPTGGKVTVAGKEVVGPGSDRPMVFQQDTVFPWMHVRDNVEFGLRSKGTAKGEREKTSNRWLAAVGLETFADSWPKELSGGMRKRVALAAVLALDANVILMDEPFGSLDYFTRRSLHELLLDLWAQTHNTIFFVTHDIEEALILADRVLLIKNGQLVDDLRVGLPRPRDEDVRARPEAVELQKTILGHLGFGAEVADDRRIPAEVSEP